MNFISFSFAVFFILFVCLYHISAKSKKHSLIFQQILILCASFVFYAFADFHFIPFLLYIIAISYFAGIFTKSRLSFALFLIADLVPLLFFKYTPQEWHKQWIFPLGLSFFTFQSISYIADCYSKKIPAEQNPLIVALYISFFPTISSGPIQRAPFLLPQLKTVHRFDYDNASDGMKLFAWGMFKKLCIADKIALYVDFVYGNAGEQHGFSLLLAAILYSFQIYCDFSGYSDMAIGLARYLGFDAGKNFDHPYLAQSIGDFWRRWHISLSTWLRDYVYIPLGGSRVSIPRIYLNLIITFLVSGIWHGAGWTFIIWGLLHGIYQCAGRATKTVQGKVRLPAIIRIVFTFCLVTFAWIFFRAEDMQKVSEIINGIAHIPQDIMEFCNLKESIGLTEAVRTEFALYDDACGGFNGMLRLFILLAGFCLLELKTRKISGLTFIKKKNFIFRWILYTCFIILFILISILEGQFGLSSNFIYNQF